MQRYLNWLGADWDLEQLCLLWFLCCRLTNTWSVRANSMALRVGIVALDGLLSAVWDSAIQILLLEELRGWRRKLVIISILTQGCIV